MRYRELKKVTGRTLDEVVTYLKKIRSDPEKGAELFSIMRNTFTLPTDTIK
jgi:hypothetical protein